MSTISLPDASKILSISPDELMFLVQTDKIQAGVDTDSLAWTFTLNDILQLKAQTELEAAEAEDKPEVD